MTDPSGYTAGDARHEYGIDKVGHVSTGEQIDQANHQTKYTEGALKPGLIQAKNHATRVDLDDQSEKLTKEYDGGKRPVPATEEPHYQGIDHEELYEWVHSADSSQVGEIAAAWTKIGNKIAEGPNLLAKAIAKSESGWTGDGAEGARRSVAGIANEAGKAARGAQLVGTLGSQQAESLDRARNTMPKPPEEKYTPEKAAQAIAAAGADKDVVRQHWDDMRVQQHAMQQEAAQVVQTYDATTVRVAQEQPAFAPAPEKPGGGGDSTGGSSTTSNYPGDSNGRVPPPQPSTGGDNSSVPHVGGDTGAETGGGTANRPPEVPGEDGGTTGTDPSSVSGPGTPVRDAPLPGNSGGSGHGPTQRPVTGGGPVGGDIPGGSGGETGGRGGRGGRGSGALRDESTVRRGTGGRSGGSGQSGRGVSGEEGRPATGRRATTGRGMTGGTGETPTGRSSTAPASRGMGRGVPAGRGGRREEDQEHETPDWVVGPDPDEFFGTQEKTAPPVIGDWWGLYDPTKPDSYNPYGDDE